MHPMNRAPVLKSHVAGRAGLRTTRRKKNIERLFPRDNHRRELFNTSTGLSGGVSAPGDELRGDTRRLQRCRRVQKKKRFWVRKGQSPPERIYLLREVMRRGGEALGTGGRGSR